MRPYDDASSSGQPSPLRSQAADDHAHEWALPRLSAEIPQSWVASPSRKVTSSKAPAPSPRNRSSWRAWLAPLIMLWVTQRSSFPSRSTSVKLAPAGTVRRSK